MEKALIRFPSIEAFKNTIRNITHQADGLNRKLNNKRWLNRQLKECKEWLSTL